MLSESRIPVGTVVAPSVAWPVQPPASNGKTLLIYREVQPGDCFLNRDLLISLSEEEIQEYINVKQTCICNLCH